MCVCVMKRRREKKKEKKYLPPPLQGSTVLIPQPTMPHPSSPSHPILFIPPHPLHPTPSSSSCPILCILSPPSHLFHPSPPQHTTDAVLVPQGSRFGGSGIGLISVVDQHKVEGVIRGPRVDINEANAHLVVFLLCFLISYFDSLVVFLSCIAYIFVF